MHQKYFIKRDDLHNVDFSGTEARKLYYFIKNDLKGINKIISHGSAQPNAMYSLSVLCKIKNLKFDYYVPHISSFL
ncbi:1-aminocyclopropane-1-carboxylate deaminase, partial [Aliarcobacter butzleri]